MQASWFLMFRWQMQCSLVELIEVVYYLEDIMKWMNVNSFHQAGCIDGTALDVLSLV
jgi:hypothetical protein